METLLEKQTQGANSVMKVGDHVRVKETVIIYHTPTNRGQAFDLKGLDGEIIGIASQWEGKTISANLPIVVQFPQISKKFRAHLRENELEIV